MATAKLKRKPRLSKIESYKAANIKEVCYHCYQGGSNFACGANYPHQALKGGYFVFVWRVGT
jgi:hypothetical protein